MVEGDFDAAVIPQLLSSVTANSMQSAGGRAAVISSVKSLAKYELPIVGVVDADVRAPDIDSAVRSRIHVWPAADIEGVLLQDDDFLTKALEGKLLKSATCPTVEAARNVLRELLASQHENAVAEYAQRLLQEKTSVTWPTARGENALRRLRGVVDTGLTVLSADLVEAALVEAQDAWDQQQPNPWKMVRGKYIIGAFVAKHTVVANKDDFITTVLARNPKIAAVAELGCLVSSLMPVRDSDAQPPVDSPGTPLPEVISGTLGASL